MLKQFLEDNTFPSPGSVVSLVTLRRRFEAKHGSVNRTAFVAAPGRRGTPSPSTPHGSSAVLVGRTLQKPPTVALSRTGA